MEVVESCPLPELAEALRPYIRPREEVTSIRSGIDALLTEHIGADDIPLSKVTLPSLDDYAHPGNDHPFSGVRKAFVKALAARQKAQAQYDALKAELGLSRNGSLQEENHGGDVDDNSVADTVSLIRQKQRQKKLLIIENTLDDLEKARQGSGHADATELLNGSRQSQQPPPLAQQDQDEYMTAAQSKVFELQKAVLRAQSRLQTRDYLKDIQAASPGGDVLSESNKRAFALGQARDNLIAWIEEKLAKLSEDTIEDPDLRNEDHDEHETESPEEIQAALRELYDIYISSRETLVDVLNTKSQVQPNVSETASQQSPQTDKETVNSTDMASTILPFVEILRSAARDETALMQHTSYLRRQLTAASSNTDRLITRLSEESHLVRPGTSHASAWTEAAKEARLQDHEVIQSHLATGEGSVVGARGVLGSAQRER